MKTPVSWLKEYVDFDDTIEGLVGVLTFSGIEVEGVATVGGDMEGVVAGRVTAVEPHPNADRLRLCNVDDGSATHRVVCGAPNVETGAIYPFAPTGITLPNGLKLKKTKIRGEVSEGMLCAEDELGLSDDHEGLMVLDASVAPGTPLAEVIGPPEVVLDLEITPNRPDCLSMLGVARELAALYQSALKVPDVDDDPRGDAAIVPDITVADPLDCPRYTGRVIDNIAIGPSPAWMQRRLTLAGVRPINTIVDITNYVMLETGQPLHAFDYHALDGGKIEVRRAAAGETMATLDGEDRPLTPESLVIADATRPVAIAGIMGGAGSEIEDTSRTVLLESAVFQPSLVRTTSRRLGLSTESSYRFERGVDVDGADWASRRAASLMREFAGGAILPGAVDVYPSPPQPAALTCRYERINALIGLDIPAETVHAHLRGIGLEVAPVDDASCRVTVPSFRGDLEREVDLIEEVARLHGLDLVPAPLPRSELVHDADDRPVRELMDVRARMISLGLNEIMNYSALAPEQLDLYDPGGAGARIVLPNPLSQDQSVLRTSLVPQLIESLARNASRQIHDTAFFEMGRVYHRSQAGSPVERERLAAGLMGHGGGPAPLGRTEATGEELFGRARGLLAALARGTPAASAALEPLDRAPWRAGYSVAIRLEGLEIGCLGLLAEAAAREERLPAAVALLEIDLDPVRRPLARAFSAVPLAMFPAISRDVALIVDISVKNQDILDIIQRAAPKELESVRLFDIFVGEGIGDGKKSLAYSFSYRSPERTLTDEEANRFHDGVKAALREGVHADLRDG